MKTFLLFVTVLSLSAAGYFYFNARQPAAVPTPPVPVVVEAPATVPESSIEIAERPPQPPDNRPLAIILRERVRWPAEFALTRPLRVPILIDGAVAGESVLEAGRILRASLLTDDGRLKAWLGDRVIDVPYENTDFVDRAAAQPARVAPAALSPEPAQRVAPPRSAGRVAGPTLAELKERFPPKHMRTVGYLKDKKFYLTETRTTLSEVQGNRVVKQTQRNPALGVSGKPDTLSIEVPHPDVYSFYKGMVLTATMEGLPRSLKMMEDRIQQDLARLGGTGSLHHSVETAQAAASAAWINGTLRPYLAQLRAITVGR